MFCFKCGSKLDKLEFNSYQCAICGVHYSGSVDSAGNSVITQKLFNSPDTDVGYEFQGFYISQRMLNILVDYINYATYPGDFLSAIISNNLNEAVKTADEVNKRNIVAFVGYLYNKAPISCWGSKEIMDSWKGLKHLEKIDGKNSRII